MSYQPHINVSQETKDDLNSLKIANKETYNEIVKRLIKIARKIIKNK